MFLMMCLAEVSDYSVPAAPSQVTRDVSYALLVVVEHVILNTMYM